MEYNFFGSADSTDIDLIIKIDAPVSTQEAKTLCIKYDDEMYNHFKSDREVINSNLCTVTDGVISWVHKGTVDEVNNCILRTYDLHTQDDPIFVCKPLERNVELKVARALRTILQMASRSQYRDTVKDSLKSHDALTQLACLSKIDFTEEFELNKNDLNWVEYRKAIAFQVGQTVALLNGDELYTKKEISAYGDLGSLLTNMLYREPIYYPVLQRVVNEFVTRILKSNIDFTKIKE